MTAKDIFVFDSHALLKFFQKEEGCETVARLIEQSRKSKTERFLCAINLGEIIYATKRAFGDQKKIEVLAHIERLQFTIIPATNEMVFQAAEYKAQYSISYADCFVLASAVERKAVIVTGDPEFKKVEHLVKIMWV